MNTSVNSNSIQTFNVERFWEIENYGTVPKHNDRIMTKDEKRTFNILFKEENCETGLLWREDRVNLPSNRQLTAQRLQALEKKVSQK